MKDVLERLEISYSPSWAQKRNENQLFQIISYGVWPNYELLPEILKKNINEKAWRWRMSSKSSRDSGVRIRRDKLENERKTSFPKPYLMGSDLNPRVSEQNLEEKSWWWRDYGVRIRRDKLENAVKTSFSRPYLMGSDPNPAISGQNLEDKHIVVSVKESESWKYRNTGHQIKKPEAH